MSYWNPSYYKGKTYSSHVHNGYKYNPGLDNVGDTERKQRPHWFSAGIKSAHLSKSGCYLDAKHNYIYNNKYRIVFHLLPDKYAIKSLIFTGKYNGMKSTGEIYQFEDKFLHNWILSKFFDGKLPEESMNNAAPMNHESPEKEKKQTSDNVKISEIKRNIRNKQRDIIHRIMSSLQNSEIKSTGWSVRVHNKGMEEIERNHILIRLEDGSGKMNKETGQSFKIYLQDGNSFIFIGQMKTDNENFWIIKDFIARYYEHLVDSSIERDHVEPKEYMDLNIEV